ncbi:hypothetical protein SAMN05444267_102641 [Chryseobacterium polytrichastri]|uniref:Uncharacterized protein n=2 Tax=Chryseobacterium polytrichastri TaxID=1302687 RepID=A0A1M7DYP9_9FLAO|nr:hypothetical protein SAMN05444267_102641 [Chryseobacterium polytrichastri]
MQLFYIGFFLPNLKIINMKDRLIYLLPIFLMVFAVSCGDKKLQDSQHTIDLFKDQRQEGKAYVMSAEESSQASAMVITSSNVKLVDSDSGRGRPVFIYKVNDGEVVKTTRDSIVTFPFQFLSNHKLDLKKEAMYLYLQKLEGYRFIAKDKNLKYQWLKDAPVYSVKADK